MARTFACTFYSCVSTNMKPDLRLEFEADKVYFLKHASCLPAKICNTSQSKNILQAFSSNRFEHSTKLFAQNNSTFLST